ncbi:MAG TPA: SPOR domain-containing protein, partial [Methylocella sp.]|nr:SPOR domain-containing protein [Methylocella sp.]
RTFAGHDEDPYKTVFEPFNRRPSGGSRGDQDRSENKLQRAQQPTIGGDFASIEAGLLGGVKRDSADEFFAPEVGGYEHHEDSWPFDEAQAGAGAMAPFEETRSRRPLWMMAALIATGLAGIGASFGFKTAMDSGQRQDEIATIKAVEGPTKVQPEILASNEAQDRDATVVGGAPQQPPVAAVYSAEQPTDLSARGDMAVAEANESLPEASGSGAASVPVPPPPAPAVQPPVQAQAPQSSDGIAALIVPKKVKTVAVRPDGSIIPDDALPQAAAAVERPAPSPKATGKTIARATTPKPAAVSGTPEARTVIAKAKPVQLASADGQSSQQASSQAATGGSFAVQLAAPGSEQEARETQAKLIKKYSGELAGLHPSIQKAEVGGKPVYRVRVSGLTSRDAATALCQKVQSGGGSCFVAKN